MLRIWGCAVLAFVLAASSGVTYSIRLLTTPPPKELKEPFRKLLDENTVQLLDDKGGVVAQIWFRKEIPVKATAEQIKNGLTYREIEETTFLGAVRFDQQYIDYRKQKIKPGVYTLRLGFQPMDGDHMGTAPYPEFCLLIPAAVEDKPDLIEVKEMRERSDKAPGGSHPGIMLLFPNDKPDATPKLVDKGMGHGVLMTRAAVSADGQKAVLGLGLTLLGHTAAE